MTTQETRRKSMSGDHRPACIDYTALHRREAAELRQYQQITRAVQAAARTYGKRTGAYINPDEYPPADLAAAAYIIIQETGTRLGETPGDTIRRAAYEAVRRAARDQRRHAHLVELDDHDKDAEEAQEGAPDARLEAIEAMDAIAQAIQQAGPVAAMLADGMTPSDISRAMMVSRSTAWRLVQRAREQIRRALDMCPEADRA